MMRIVVCVKHVADTQVPLHLDQRATGIEPVDLARIPNPADLAALEQAVQIARALSAEVVVACLGPKDAARTLRLSLALGANRAVLVTDPVLEETDPYVTSMALARLIAPLDPRLVLCGTRSTDGGSGQVGPALADALGLCHVGAVASVLHAGCQRIVVERKLERGTRQRVECHLPVLLTVDMDMPKVDDCSLPALLKSLSQPIEVFDLCSLGLRAANADIDLSLVRITGLGFPRPRPRRAPGPKDGLNAIERIQAILEGGMADRGFNLLAGPPSILAGKAVDCLMTEGLLDAR
jgi:electron transfer flavoprotein beta subunit